MQVSVFGFTPTALVGGAAYTALLGCACVSDVRNRRIPNWLAALLGAAGMIYSVLVAGSPIRGFALSVAGLLLGLTLWLPLYAIRWLGAGDVKLFAAAGAWLGPVRTVEGAFIAAFAGGVLGAIWMLRAYGVNGTAATVAQAMSSPITVVNHPVDARSRRAIPYGVALAVGALAAAWFPDILSPMFNAAH